MREACLRCGKPVPTRMRGTGYCTVRCMRAQEQDDRESWEIERAEADEK
jgi:hypothetical protein